MTAKDANNRCDHHYCISYLYTRKRVFFLKTMFDCDRSPIQPYLKQCFQSFNFRFNVSSDYFKINSAVNVCFPTCYCRMCVISLCFCGCRRNKTIKPKRKHYYRALVFCKSWSKACICTNFREFGLIITSWEVPGKVHAMKKIPFTFWYEAVDLTNVRHLDALVWMWMCFSMQMT